MHLRLVMSVSTILRVNTFEMEGTRNDMSITESFDVVQIFLDSHQFPGKNKK